MPIYAARFSRSRFFRIQACFLLAAAISFFPIWAVAAAPPVIQVVSGNNQYGQYASAFLKPFVVWVGDGATGRSLAGVSVRFIASPEITLSAGTAETDSHGMASVTGIGAAIGNASLRAEVEAFSGDSVDFEGLSVGKAVITIVPADMQSEVGVIPAIAGYTLTGFVDGDTAESAGIVGSPLLTTTATASSPDANYAIKGGLGTLSSSKYDFEAGFGTLILRGAGNPKAEEAKTVSPESRIQVRQAMLIQLETAPENRNAMSGESGNAANPGESVQAALKSVTAASNAPETAHPRVSPSAALEARMATNAKSASKHASEDVQVALRPTAKTAPSDGPLPRTLAALPARTSATPTAAPGLSAETVREAIQAKTLAASGGAGRGANHREPTVMRIGLPAPATK
jgi:hypothetical protein